MLTLMILAALADAGDATTIAAADSHAMKILQVAATPGGSPLYIRVAAGDLDGDGVADRAIVKLVCAANALTQSYFSVDAPRDAASGQASGKRQHGSVVLIKEWGPASPQLQAITATYDLKAMKSARSAGTNRWHPISLSGVDTLCAAATVSAATIYKSKSNIKNN